MIKGFLKFGYGTVISLIIGLIAAPIITRVIEPKDLALSSYFLLCMNFGTLGSLFGADQMLARYYYILPDMRRNLAYYASIKSMVFFLFLAFIFCLYKVLCKEFEESTISYFILLAFAIIANILLSIVRIYLRVSGRAHLFSLSNIFGKLVRLATLAIVYVFYTKNHFSLIIADVVAIMGTLLLVVIGTMGFWQGARPNLSPLPRAELFKFSYPLGISTVVFVFFQGVDQLVLKYSVKPADYGVYMGGMRIVALLQVLVTVFNNYWTPLVYDKLSNQTLSEDSLKNVWSLLFCAFFIVITPIFLFSDFLVVYLGEAYRESSRIIPLLAFIPMMQLLSSFVSVGLNYEKKTKVHMMVITVTLIVTAIFTFYSTSFWSIMGTAIGMMFGYTIYFLLYYFVSMKVSPVFKVANVDLIILISFGLFIVLSSMNAVNNLTVALPVFGMIYFHGVRVYSFTFGGRN